jgi:hypothetical protein
MLPTGRASTVGCADGRLPEPTPAPVIAIAIVSYLGTSSTFDAAIASFAETFADQNHRDYEKLQKAVAGGRIVAWTGL